MYNFMRLITMGLVVAFLMVGCAHDDVVMPNEGSAASSDEVGKASKSPDGITRNVSALTLPAGAVINSATLRLYCYYSNGKAVEIYAYPSEWTESTVTYTQMDAAMPGAVKIYGPVVPTVGYWDIPVTDQAKEWITTTDNFGLLIRQVEPTTGSDFTMFWSSECAVVNYDGFPGLMLRPALEINYNDNQTATVRRETSNEVYDSYGRSDNPDANYGSLQYFSVGLTTGGLVKPAIIKFDLSVESQGGCTHTIGYWKTHAGFGPQADDVTPLLPQWLGNVGGTKSRHVTTAADAVDYLQQKVYGGSKNGISKLYSQLLGAKLSLASGANGAPIISTVNAADSFLASYDWTSWTSLTAAQKSQVLAWAETLGMYNNGLFGVAHCD